MNETGAMQGFGAAGLGIVTVSGVPGLPALRQQLLTLADAFAVSLSKGVGVSCTTLHNILKTC